MSLNLHLISEIRQEGESTRKLLERVPIEKAAWKPHKKSMPLGRLAMHVAEIPGWTAMTLLTDELDFAKFEDKRRVPESMEELLAKHDEHIAQAISVLEHFHEDEFNDKWTMKTGDVVHFSLPKHAVLRRFAFSHLYHHRAQLGVYLRLLDIRVPGVYGPTADDFEEMTAAAQKEHA